MVNVSSHICIPLSLCHPVTQAKKVSIYKFTPVVVSCQDVLPISRALTGYPSGDPANTRQHLVTQHTIPDVQMVRVPKFGPHVAILIYYLGRSI